MKTIYIFYKDNLCYYGSYFSKSISFIFYSAILSFFYHFFACVLFFNVIQLKSSVDVYYNSCVPAATTSAAGISFMGILLMFCTCIIFFSVL